MSLGGDPERRTGPDRPFFPHRLVLTARDPLPERPERVLVAGTSGAGKTTVADRIASVLGLPRVEIDALHHGPGWQPRPEFRADVQALAAEERWVVEWQYAEVRPLLAERADLLVWLDLPRRVVMRQVVRRTLVRRLRRSELWNGNVEPPLRTFFGDPDHIVRWAWRTHPETAERVASLPPGLTVVRLRRRGETERWLRGPLQDARYGGS
jgi:adenylate kinase family enzyme